MTCNAGFSDCNANRADGCEVAVANDINHCGRCANRCSYPNGVAACVSGGCRLVSCLAGFANADGFSENGCELQVAHVGNGGISPFSGGTLRGLGEDPATGAISPSGMVSTTTSDFLWVVNVAESTVSKWDATARREIARYRVGLPAGECNGRCCWDNGCNMPSRVVIDGNGDAYVANRAFGMQGTVTKIAGDRADCVDRNGNGMIETSTGAGNVLPYGASASSDECVLWNANVGASNAVLRSITIDRGDASAPNGYVWVSGYEARRLWRLNPRTGAVLNELNVSIQPYGSVVTRDGTLWLTTIGSQLQPVNTTALTVGAVVNTPFSIYGPTADSNGRLWFVSGGSFVQGYDPATNTTTRVNLRAGTSSGVTSDALGNIITALNEGGNRTSIVRFPSSAFVAGPSLGSPGTIPSTALTYIDGPTAPTLNQATAVGVDRSGATWVASYSGASRLVRFDPTNADPAQRLLEFTGPNRTYSYSDFTGSVRRASIPQGSYEQSFDTTCAAPRLGNLTINGTFPAGTTTIISMRTAATAADLAAATPVAIGTLPPSASPYNLPAIFTAAGITPSQHLRMTMVLRASDGGAIPIVESFRFTWTCP
jgi:streptogramin lyase